MGQSKEQYNATPIAANGSFTAGVAIAGFLCTVSGNLTITDALGNALVSALPVTAGQWTRIPLFFPSSAGGTLTLSGGAAGTVFA